MHNTKIIKLLKSLDQYEIRKIRDFVNSPVFNKNRNVAKLLDEIKKYYPKFQSDDLNEEFIYRKIFGKEEFDYFKFKNTVSDLFVLAKEFLAFIRYKKNTGVKEQYLLAELRDRNLDSVYEQTYKAAVKANEALSVKDEKYVLNKLDLTEELLSFYSPKRPNEDIHMQQEKLDLFIRYSLIRFLKFYNIMMHEEKQNNFKYKMGMFDEVLKYIEDNKIDDNPTLVVYYNIILLEKERKDKYFYQLKSLKEKYKDELSYYDRYMIFLHMSGHCAQMFNGNSRTDLLKEHFELVKEKIDDEPKDLEKILYPDFLNEVKIAVRVNEFKWADDYINKYCHRLEEEKESTLNFCYGYINYKKGNYDEALSLFSKTYFPNFIIKLQVKIFYLQIFFEKGYYEQAISMIDTFRHYLKREKTIKEDFKESFYEYLRITNELIKLKTDHSIQDRDFHIKKLKSEIDNMKNNQFGIKLWLNEKLNMIS